MESDKSNVRIGCWKRMAHVEAPAEPWWSVDRGGKCTCVAEKVLRATDA